MMDNGLVTLIIGLLAGGGAGYLYFKKLLTDATGLLVAIRDAATDDRISEEEFQDIVARGRYLISTLQSRFHRTRG